MPGREGWTEGGGVLRGTCKEQEGRRASESVGVCHGFEDEWKKERQSERGTDDRHLQRQLLDKD